jgi:DNA processing protein
MDNGLDIDGAFFVAVLHAALSNRLDPLADGIGRLRALVSAGAPRPALFAAVRTQLARHGVDPDWTAGERVCDWLSGRGRSLLVLGAAGYPPLLAAVPAAPPVLFVDGHAGLLSAPQLAIVGSRRATPSARDLARTLAHELAGLGLTITSGLASGIDGAAHEGALGQAGSTIAVFGCGVDRIYPASHRELAARVRAEGAVVAEFPLGQRPAPAMFPRRNRIISGLALGTLVVEAALTSGSLVTARHALDQGREVFAVPGAVCNPLSRGCHALLRDGAVLTETVADILAELRGFAPGGPSGPSAGSVHPAESRSPDLSPEQRQVYAACDFMPRGVDLIIDECGLTAPEVSSILTALEMKGVVRATTGGAYVRTGKIPA